MSNQSISPFVRCTPFDPGAKLDLLLSPPPAGSILLHYMPEFLLIYEDVSLAQVLLSV